MRLVVIVFALLALAVMGVGVLWANAGHEDYSGLVDAGGVQHLFDRGVTYVAPAKAFVVSTPGGLIALRARSPHLGEPISYCASSGWFEDRMHGAMFDGEGNYVLGPAQRGLDRFDVRIEAGEAYVDTTEILLGPPRDIAHDRQPAGPFCMKNA